MDDIKSATKCLIYSKTKNEKIKNLSVPHFDFITVRHPENAKKSMRPPNFYFITVRHQEKEKKSVRQQPYSNTNAILVAVHVPDSKPTVNSNVHLLKQSRVQAKSKQPTIDPRIVNSNHPVVNSNHQVVHTVDSNHSKRYIRRTTQL